MKNIMFMTIGNRDLQMIYQSNNKMQSKRWEYKLNAEQDLNSYEIVDPTEIREKSQEEKELVPTNKICFPMFCKAMSYLNSKQVMQIDHLYLICSKRVQIVSKLSEIHKYKGIPLHVKDYAKALLDHAAKDKTWVTSSVLSKCILDGTLPALDIKIANVTVLNLGTYGFLDPVLDIEETNPGIISILRRADINILDFFESELYNGLKAHFALLENSNIYLSTYSGGMPLMQRALDTVLESCLGFARYIRVFNSEHLSYQIESDPQEEFLSLLKKVTDSIFKLDWASAKRHYDVICSIQNCPLPESAKTTIGNVLSDIETLHNSGEDQWFDRFTILILKALYNKEFNDIIIWIKCIEEAAWEEILLSQCGTRWKSVKTSINQKTKKKELRVIFYPSENCQKESCAAYINEVAKQFDNDNLREVLHDYISVFGEANSWKMNKTWRNIANARNKLVHTGLSAYGMAQQILQFLDINEGQLDDQILNIQNRNLKAIEEFELKCMNNKFFKPIRNISGHRDEEYLPQDRILCKEYLNALHCINNTNNTSNI